MHPHLELALDLVIDGLDVLRADSHKQFGVMRFASFKWIVNEDIQKIEARFNKSTAHMVSNVMNRGIKPKFILESRTDLAAVNQIAFIYRSKKFNDSLRCGLSCLG